jgi:hypothetical protein
MVVVLLLISIFAQAGKLSAELPLDAVKNDKLRKALREVTLQLLLGNPLVTRSNARDIAWGIFNRGLEQERIALGYALAMQAVAEATLNLDREALWHWDMAQVMVPTLRAELVQSYSAVVGMFDASDFRDQPSAIEYLSAKGEWLPAEGDKIQAARVQDKAPILSPSQKRNALVGQRVEVSYLVDQHGRTYTPVVEEGADNTLAVFTVLESILVWGHAPASFDGETRWSRLGGAFSFQKER